MRLSQKSKIFFSNIKKWGKDGEISPIEGRCPKKPYKYAH